MKAFIVTLAVAAALVGAAAQGGTWRSEEKPPRSVPTNPVGLRPVGDFDRIRDRSARSQALFLEAGKVIQSPRCMNCHPRNDRPTQTDAMTPHQPLAMRGLDGHGPVGGVNCKTCHGPANYDVAGVPGNPKWGLAPLSMAWQGRSIGQICRQIKDPKLNGGRDLLTLTKHFAHDDLVGWGWRPGGGRMPAPGSQKAMGELIAAWVDAGASCPPA